VHFAVYRDIVQARIRARIGNKNNSIVAKKTQAISHNRRWQNRCDTVVGRFAEP